MRCHTGTGLKRGAYSNPKTLQVKDLSVFTGVSTHIDCTRQESLNNMPRALLKYSIMDQILKSAASMISQ